ncbi:hypothetical protein J6A31_09165 [bacterium]|nr:hypothetical protein [bacterium]
MPKIAPKYIVKLTSGTFYTSKMANDLKELVIEMEAANHYDTKTSNLFKKALTAMESAEDIVALFNHFSQHRKISEITEIKAIVYTSDTFD